MLLKNKSTGKQKSGPDTAENPSASRFPAACPAKTARIPRKNATAAASSGPTRETPAPIPAARLSRDNATAREAASPADRD